LPRPVYEEAKRIVEKEKGGAGPVVSMNDLIVLAIRAYVKTYKRRQIDAMFAHMAEDADYQKEAKLLAEEFSESDWEALQIGESALRLN
jgi:ribosomal silencing factor RsfS